MWTRPEWPSSFMVSTMPRAVSGLTKQEAPSRGSVPSGRSRASAARTHRYSAYISPPRMATVRPSRAWASGEAPAATTSPAPSLPTGRAAPARAATARRRDGGMGAERTADSPLPETLAFSKSAGPTSRPRSAGLMGVARTRTRTSPSPGFGVGTRARDRRSSEASAVTSVRSWRKVSGTDVVMGAPLFVWAAIRSFEPGVCQGRAASPIREGAAPPSPGRAWTASKTSPSGGTGRRMAALIPARVPAGQPAIRTAAARA